MHYTYIFFKFYIKNSILTDIIIKKNFVKYNKIAYLLNFIVSSILWNIFIARNNYVIIKPWYALFKKVFYYTSTSFFYQCHTLWQRCDNDPENPVRFFDPLQIYGLYYGSSSTRSGRVITLVAGLAKIRDPTIICHGLTKKRNIYNTQHSILYINIDKKVPFICVTIIVLA